MQNRIEINETNPEALICVYGTLRKGNGNYQAILAGKSEYLGTYQTSPNYTMFGRNAGFPIVTTDGDQAITYEVHRVTTPAVLERVHNLEGCTGIPGDPKHWYDIIPVETPHGVGHMYVMHNNNVRNSASIIKTGDWSDKNN